MTMLLLPERRHAKATVLDRWIALGDRLPDAVSGNEVLLCEVFAFEGPLAVAALTRQLDVGDAENKQWLRADPAWVRADMSTARMFAHGELGLSAAEIAALTPDLVALFAEHNLVFDTPTPARWYLACPDSLSIPDFTDPDDALGDDLRLHALPGVEGKFWRVLGNDIQVMLHNHPVNQNRVARGAVAVNGLWLWGGGRQPKSITCNADAYFGNDPLATALANAASLPTRSLDTLDSNAAARNAIIDLRNLRADALEAAIGNMAAFGIGSRIKMFAFTFASGERYRYRPSHRWRFWRR